MRQWTCFPRPSRTIQAMWRFHVARRDRSISHLDGFGTTQTGGVPTTELVPTVTLDWLAMHFPLPNVVKIDVEAAGMKVLAGSPDVLRALPMIICEVAASNWLPFGIS